MPGWGWMAIGAVVTVVIVVRRVRGEPLRPRHLWVAPVVLTALGVGKLISLSPGFAALWWVIGGSAVGLALGFLRGWVVVVYEQQGRLWQRYTWHTFAVAASSALLLAGFDIVAMRLGAHPDAQPVILAVGVSFLGESAAVTVRALRSSVPFTGRS